HFVAGDRIAVSGSTGNNEIYTVDSVTYDVYSDTTTIVVSEDVASDAADGSLIKTMDFGINLGPLGLQSNDAVLSIGLSAGVGLDHKLTQDELETGGDAYTLLTSLTASMSEDSQYTIVLPVSWNGLLAGVNDGVGFITATSAIVQPGGSIAAFLTSIPSSIQITGMSDLLKFSGLSLDTILAALEDTADDLIGTDTEVLGTIVGGAVDAATGEFTGGQLKVYNEIWGTSTTLTSGFTPTMTSGVQNSKVVEDTNGNKLRLLEWTVTAGTVWGLELATGPNASELQTYSIAEYKLIATYDADDVAVNQLTADVQTNVTLRDGATTASGNLSRFRLRDGELYNDIPMLGVSLADMLGDGAVSFAAGFGNAIHTVRDSARNIGELQDQLNAELRSFFSLPNTVNLVTLSYDNGAFDFDLDLEQAITRTYNLELDIEQLNLQQWLGFDPAQFLDISLTAPVNLSANVDLHLGFGFDLSNVFDPSFYVDAETGVTAHASGVAPDIDAKLSIDLPAIGPIDLPALGLNIIDGSAHIQADFFANLGDPAADSDGDGRISPMSIGTAFQAELSGSAAVDLPIFFPTASMPLGGSTKDLDGNGIADNALHAEAAFSIDQNFTLQTSYSYSLPNVSMNFDAVQAFIAYIDNAENVLSGMEGFFSGIDKVADGIDSISLPIIGGSAFDSFANALRDIRSSVLGTKTGATYADGSFGKWLQDQGTNSIIDSVLNEIRQALFDGFDSLNDSTGAKTNGVGGSLFAFVVPDLDEFGAKQYDANGKMVVKIPTSANDIQVDFTANGLLTFNLMFGGTLVDGELPIDFSAGIPGVSLEIDAKLQAHIDYLMGIGLGIGNVSKTAVPQIGFFVDTKGINTAGEELALDVSAELADGSTATGTLGFLKMTFTESTAAGERTGLWGHFGLDIRDADGDGKWKIGEGVSLAMNASAFAEAHLVAGVETTAGNFLPSVSTTIHYTQMLGNVTLSTNGKASIEFGSPDVVLQDVTLNVGTLFKSFLADTLSTIHDIVTPLKPVVDLLLMEIPLGGIASPPIRFIDIARLRLPASVVETMTKVLQVLDSTIKFLDTVDELASAGSINFGTFHLTEASAKNPNADLSAADTASTGRDDSALTAGQKKILAGPDQKGLDGNSLTTSSATKGKKKPPKKNFTIPVLEDPASLLSFIMGRGDVDLFWYDLPDLNLFFEYQRSFPVFAGLNVGLFGSVGVTTNFDFGFDTRGLRQWMDTDFDPSESWRIFNGFYLDDHGQENTSADKPELVLNAAIGASVSLGIGGLVEAGVRGGLEATINFDLNDFETQIVNDLPVGDGKLYGSELLDRLGHGVECLFDVDGQLKVFLEAYLWIGLDLGFSTITLFKASERFVDEIIVKFDWECIHEAPASIAQTSVDLNGDKVLTLSYQNSNGTTYNPGTARHAYKVEALPINDDLDLAYLLTNGYFDPEYSTLTEEIALRDQLAALRTAYPDGDRKVIVVSNGLRVQVYLDSDVDTIRTTGTSGNDVYDFKRLDGVVKNIDMDMGAGNDTFNSTGDSDNNGGGAAQGLTSILINGGAGEDYINVDSSMLESGSYILRGGADNDRVKIGGIYSGYTGVTIEGGLGDDKLTGGDGPDRIFGGHDDTSSANTVFDGFDFIVGNGGDDLLDGGDEYEGNGTAAAHDVAVYSPLTGSLYAPGAELRVSEIYEVVNGVVRPFQYYDKMGRPIQSAPDSNGNGVLVTLTNTNFTARNFPGDVIDGGDGNDTIRGGHGFDQIIGGAGTNIIYGEEGNDTIEAGTGNVTVNGGAGDDVITWNYAPFTQAADTDLQITGGAGTRDQLKAVAVTQTTAALNNNTFGLTEATDTTAAKDARLTIGSNRMLLDGIENVSLDGRTGDDTMNIGSLLNTDIESLDLQLGSDLAKMWSVQRDVSGTHQVFPANYGATDTNPGGVVASQDDLREGQYFYRYDLADNGVYLFNSDGSPMLADIITPATVSGANQETQTVALSDGLDRVTLYYGYDASAPRSGYLEDSVVGTTLVKGNGVEVHAGMTTTEIEDALKSLDQVSTVSVTGAGTLADPWTITITSANTDTNGVFAQFGQIYSVQSYIGALAQRDDTRVAQRFYRVSDEQGIYLFQDDANPATADAPVLVEKVTAASLIDGNRVQFLALNAWDLGSNQDAILWYGNEGIVIESGDAASVIADRMTTQLTGVTGVTVLGSGTDTDPWSFEFTAATQVNEKYLQLELASGGGNLSTAAKVTRSTAIGSTVTPAANDRQLLSIPANATKITLTYGGDTTSEIDLLNGGPAAIKTALQNLNSVTTVSVARGATATAPWIISLIAAAQDADGKFLSLKSSVTSEMSAAYLSTLGTGNNSKIQTIDFGGSARGIITYGRNRLVVDPSMNLATINALFDGIEGDLNGSTVAVTGTYGNWTANFTAEVSDQTFDRILFTTEEAVAAPTTVSLVADAPVNRQQSIVLPASAATIFYGSSGIDINSGTVTAAILKAKLEALTGIRQAEVTGQGTVGSPWIVTLVDADVDAGGALLRVSGQAFTQSGNVIQTTLGGVSPNQFSYQRTLRTTESATQSILLPEWQTYSTVRYGVDSVDLLRSMTATEVEAALESLDSVRDVWVVGSGQIIRTDTLQRQTIPGVSIAEGMVFKYGNNTVTLAAGDLGTDTADQATKLQTKLRTLAGMGAVTVSFLDATSEFQITFPAAGATQLSFKSADPFIAAVPGVDVTETLQRQSIPSSALAVGTQFKYGLTTATLAAGDIGTFNPDKVSKLQTKLRTMTGMSDVVVTFVSASSEFLITFPTAGATVLSYKLDGPFTEATAGVDITSDPWNIVILDADRDQYGNFMVLETVVAVQKMKRTLDVTTTFSAATQRVPAAAIVVGTQFLDNTLNVTLAAGDISTNTTTQASLLQAKLRTLSPAFEFVTVSYSTVGGNFFEVQFPASQTLQYTVSAGSAVNATADELLGADLQFVPETVIAADTTFTYNGVTVNLVTADIATGPELDTNGDVVKTQEEVQAALLQARLRTHSNLKLVTVGYIAGDTAGTGRFGIAMPIPAPVIYLSNGSSSAQLADPTTITVGGLTLPLSLNGAIFRKDATTKTVSLLGDAATVRAALIAQLTGLNGTVKIQGSGVAGDPWIIELSGYNSATPITAEYDFGQYGDVTPDVLVTPALAIVNADVVAGTQILVGSESIVLAAADISATRATQATLLETKIRTLTGLGSAEVTYDANQFFINFAAAETLDVQIVSGNGFYTAFTNDGLVTQLIAGRDIAVNSAFKAGTSIVTLQDADIDNSSTSTQAALLQTRLRTLTALADVTVTYSAGNYLLGFTNGATPVAISFVSGSSLTALEASEKTLGRINIAANLQSVRLFFDGRSRIFQREDFATDALALDDLQAKLDALSPGSKVRIDTSALATLGYQITIEGYDPSNPLIVTIDHGDFLALANNKLETLKIVEQRDEAGVWHTLTSGGTSGVPLAISLFGDTDSAASEDKFIAPYMTIEQEGPRLIELPTWAPDANGNLVQTGQTDFFASNEIVTDNDVDKVTISGTSGRDYFLIGHEIVPLGGFDADGNPLQETKTNTVQINHR
ncbi:MAG: calcium-binding protein, partial [Planctomycetaceae bacterium]|nr:calcium-binding protein [Planctomycetaceae bacterium]